jgi:peptidoglycan/LPS O-acetylase OafA/YrhL
MATRELQSLTPLRGIAAIWVICFHYAVCYFPTLHPEQFSGIFNKGFLAVDIFFMLSGFVLSHVYWRSFTPDIASKQSNYLSFIGARIARLYPLHMFNLGLFLAATVVFALYRHGFVARLNSIPVYGARSLTALLANVAMLQGLKASALAWNYPAWSISVEFLAYFLFPFALPCIEHARGSTRALAAVGVVAAFCLFAWLSGGDFNQWDGPIALLRCLPEFVLGALLYAGLRDCCWPDWFKNDSAAILVFSGELVLLHFGAPDMIIVAGFPALILSAVMNAGRFASILNTAPLVWLGNISYSLYLAHGFVQYLTSELLSSVGVGDAAHLSYKSAAWSLFAMTGVTLLMAAFTHRAVEVAGRTRLRELLGARREGPALAQDSRSALR